ncbi:hypothetical protein PghCCS26_47640 [Paenibacillus glycanilyticus]|uniref:Integrase n=1 Tax=Paenibacillus glycanilyticus TaxID=126569 RepID=A0ABQ6NS74_9BACL|nr:hypothetical protein [Paenibacillus glycanilyticus]GMK47634.1 hypothetical protein PghCCS26_47640 [Paenibacillus glycanilyticus]
MAQLTYTEKYAQLTAQIIDNVKCRKTDVHLRFAYNGTAYDLADRTQRIELIGYVSRDYALEHGEVNQRAIDAWEERGCKGERPASLPLDSALLDRLTDAILDEELTDPHPDKVTRTEYPFMSDWQLDLRRDRETGLKAAEETATDGLNYRKPTKRRRTNYEHWCVDNGARSRNVGRAAQYKRDTAPGPVVTVKSEPFTAAKSVAATWRERLSLVY